MVCLPVQRDNSQALASGSLTVQADKPRTKEYLGHVLLEIP